MLKHADVKNSKTPEKLYNSYKSSYNQYNIFKGQLHKGATHRHLDYPTS